MSKRKSSSQSGAALAVTSVPAVVDTRIFAAELAWVQRFLETKSTIPILTTVMLVKSGPVLTLTATDLEIAGETQVDCSADSQDFTVCIPARKLLRYLAEVEDDSLSLSVNDKLILTVAHGSDGVVEIHGMSREHFPDLPKPKYEGVLSGLRAVIPRVMVAVSQEESRFTLNAALLDIRKESGGARLVSTDGHRLSLCEISSIDVADCRKLIPLSALKELAAMGENEEAGAKSRIPVTWGGSTFEIGLNGNYVQDFLRLCPETFDFKFTAPDKAMEWTVPGWGYVLTPLRV